VRAASQGRPQENFRRPPENDSSVLLPVAAIIFIIIVVGKGDRRTGRDLFRSHYMYGRR
jgi:hypothetical protein